MPTLNFASPLHSFTSGNLTFTATKDCYLCGSVMYVGTAGGHTVKIDGTIVIDVLGLSSNAPRSYIPPLKITAGQVVTCSDAFANLHILDVLS